MDWGKLDERPFDAAVWGTAAEWVGAIGTTLAALIAAGVYFWDRRTNARVQAQQIIFRHELSGGNVSVRNVSGLPVFKIKLSWKIQRYKPPPGVARRSSRKKIELDLASANASWDVIESGQTVETIHLHSQPIELDIFLKPHLVVQDVRGRFWEIPALGERRGRPKRLRKYRILIPLYLGSILQNAAMFGAALWYLAGHVGRKVGGWFSSRRSGKEQDPVDRPNLAGETLNPSEDEA